MLSISRLARQAGVSRTTVLYYERLGLLLPATRSSAGYRYYGPAEQQRLAQILSFRALGVAVSLLPALVDGTAGETPQQLLGQHLQHLTAQISHLRQQQLAIVQLLQQPALLEENDMTKERWVEIMRAAGLSDAQMKNWHVQFEQMEPQAHQQFLESLGIDHQEIARIRRWSASSAAEVTS